MTKELGRGSPFPLSFLSLFFDHMEFSTLERFRLSYGAFPTKELCGLCSFFPSVSVSGVGGSADQRTLFKVEL